MRGMLPPSVRKHGISRPTIETAGDQAVYLKWKCLSVCLLLTCYLRCVTTILRESWSAQWCMFAFSCRVSVFVPSIYHSSALQTFTLLVVLHLNACYALNHPSLIHHNHLHQPFPVTAAMLWDSIKRTPCKRQMCNCPSVFIVHMKCTTLHEDSRNLRITILCLKVFKLIIKYICSPTRYTMWS